MKCKLKCFFIILLICNLLFCASVLFGGKFIAKGIFSYDSELPLCHIQSFVVDRDESIYIGLGYYGVIQKYNSKGEFIKNWFVESNGARFDIKLTENNNLFVNARINKLYSLNGELIKKNVNLVGITMSTSSNNTFKTGNGETYIFKDNFCSEIIKIKPTKEVIVKQKFLYSIFKTPTPLFYIFIFNILLLLLFYFRNPKVRKRMHSIK